MRGLAPRAEHALCCVCGCPCSVLGDTEEANGEEGTIFTHYSTIIPGMPFGHKLYIGVARGHS